MPDPFTFTGDPIAPLLAEIERIAHHNPTVLPGGSVYVPPRVEQHVDQLMADDALGTEENSQGKAQRGLDH